MPDVIDWDSIIPSDISHINLDDINGFNGEARNLSTLSNNFATLSMIAMNRFRWDCEYVEPKDRLSEYIEYLLFWYGQCCIVREKDHYAIKRCMGSGSLNHFGKPSKFTCAYYNGEDSRTYDEKDIVWIKNNISRIPTFWLINRYIDRIAHIERVMDLNIDAQKTPYIIESAPETQLSVQNVFKKIKQMYEVIFLNNSKGGIRDKIKVLDLNAPYLVDKLYQQKVNEYNDVLNLLGINTIDIKKERLVSFEASITDQLTDNYIDMFLSTRIQAIKDFYDKFGQNMKLTVRVKREEDYDDTGDSGLPNNPEENQEVNVDEQVYDKTVDIT